MDASLCRDHLERLLVEENGLLAKLESLLDQEHEHINANDIDALDAAGRSRQECMGNLVRLEDERQSLCRMSGRNGDLQGLEDLLKWCDPRGSLQTHWSECASRAAHCRELNNRNGIVVAARLKRVEGMLNIITGKPSTPATYSARGTYSPTTTGRMVRSEA